MKRILTMLLCGALALLSGCAPAGSSSSVPADGESSLAQEDPSQAEEESRSETAAEIDPAVREMMEALAVYQPGTAGSSLKAYIAACGILNYAEEYDPSMEETLRDSITAWLAQADALTLECLLEGREAVELAAEEILAGSEEGRALLSDAGNPNRYESYSRENYDQVARILQELLDSEGAE